MNHVVVAQIVPDKCTLVVSTQRKNTSRTKESHLMASAEFVEFHSLLQAKSVLHFTCGASKPPRPMLEAEANLLYDQENEWPMPFPLSAVSRFFTSAKTEHAS